MRRTLLLLVTACATARRPATTPVVRLEPPVLPTCSDPEPDGNCPEPEPPQPFNPPTERLELPEVKTCVAALPGQPAPDAALRTALVGKPWCNQSSWIRFSSDGSFMAGQIYDSRSPWGEVVPTLNCWSLAGKVLYLRVANGPGWNGWPVTGDASRPGWDYGYMACPPAADPPDSTHERS